MLNTIFFNEKVFNDKYYNIDKNILLDDFKEYYKNLSFPKKILIECYKKTCTYKDLLLIDENKNENCVKKDLYNLNGNLKLELAGKQEGLNSYTTSKKGIKELLLLGASFVSTNDYLQEFVKTKYNADLFDTQDLIKRINNYYSNIELTNIRKLNSSDETYLKIDIADLIEYDYELVEFLLSNPDEIIILFEETIKTLLDEEKEIKVRFINIPESDIIKIGQHRKEHINKLVSFVGIVRRKSEVKPRLRDVEYLCLNPACKYSDNKIKVPQFEEKKRILKACPECKSSLDEVNKTLEDSMLLVLEQDFNERSTDFDTSKIHIKIESDLTKNNIYNKLKISNKVQVIGILRELPKSTRTGSESVNYEFIFECNNIMFLNNDDELILTKEDETEIKEFVKNPNFKHLLINNFIPDIEGNEKVKESLILQHLGSSLNMKRNNSHILLLGDPATAKTQIIRENISYSNRSVFFNGTSTTRAGMTATAIKDELTGSWVLEPGVLPRANNGLAGCDELDKLSEEDANSLLESLESGLLSINKANIHATLETKTSLLAGANPKYCRFDDGVDISKQINFNPALLSRFDLIFILKDKPDSSKDEKIIEHILKSITTDQEQELSKDFIKKYIHYCKTKFKPSLSSESKKLISDYYISIRQESKTRNYHFTPRQIEGILRFSCSYAKLNQRNEILKEDVENAIRLFNGTYNELGLLSFDESELVKTKDLILKEILKNDSLTLEDIKKKFPDIEENEIIRNLNTLKSQREIYEPRKNQFVLTGGNK